MKEYTSQNFEDISPLFIIGAGGQSIVYLAFDNNTNKLIALKVAKNQKMAGLFKREAEVIHMLNHPNIIKLESPVRTQILNQKYSHLKSKNHQESTFFAMELSNLGSLYDYVLSRKKGFSPRVVRYYAKQIINALDCVHSHGFVHKDVKLENLLLFEEGTLLKLTDFGCCLPQCPKNGENAEKTFAGTDYYMAPELYKHNGFTEKCDIFSLGVCLYILMYGKLPFGRATVSDKTYRFLALRKHNKFIDILSSRLKQDIDKDFMELLFSIWEFDPTKRASLDEIKKNRWINEEPASQGEIAEIVNCMKSDVRINYIKHIRQFQKYDIPEGAKLELSARLQKLGQMHPCD